LCSGVFSTSFGFGGEPTVQLSATINEFVTILVNTPVEELRSKGLPDRALVLVHIRFDFSELTKRALGRHWKALEPNEQREFVEAFTQRLLVAYGKTVRASGNEKIEFTGERLDGAYATVETKVVSSSGELPIEYRMHVVDKQWRIYDMVIENVSIVNNYRAQFERVIARSSVKDLLQRMKHQES
jgi:phospholipid transport system substrate-binding protein